MKKVVSIFLLSAGFLSVNAAPINDSVPKLIPQKTNVITEETVIKIENLGININSDLPELRPTVSADGNLLFFICENHPRNTKFNSVPNSQDIWFSERDSAGNWSEARHLSYPLNTVQYNALYWISPDNNRILIRGAFMNGAFVGKGVSMSTLTESGRWSEPNALVIKNYDKFDRGQQSGATMAQDGKTLLLYMSPERSSPVNDIFVCFQTDNGTWTEPKSLGKKINLPEFDEMTPYLAADGVTLYFSSNRPGGLGDNDIWKTKRLDDSWQKWSDPVNLGSPFNTPGWDAFFTLDAGGEFAYLSTSLNSYGESDIVRVKLLEREKPDPVVLVSGNVYNLKTKEPLSASLVYETLPDGKEAGNALSSPLDGAFKMVLPYNKNYSIRARADHFFAVSENLNLDSLVKAGYKEIHKDLYLAPIEIGQVVRLNNVFFDFDKSNLRPESFVELDRVVKLLQENEAIEIEMSAHTDSKGSDDYNFRLSDDRARSVREYILSKGIAANRIISQGYGETKPVVPNDTDENRQLNRRVEFKILKN
ncbi:OmpA family protein [Flavihumibacter profundi]|uniref:OmpA family protein n=1 Tax=Flavihumibacter profundi TaxID=2716883 RepID=UPI001CC3EF13|nr:OmpA family protein [Flavihumibacter profundi]MBZ5857660.1 OmpA family protein [Flavihumibacter profundi]